MKVLVIGGAGFVGRYLLKELVSARYETHATHLSEDFTAEGAQKHSLDITDPQAVESFLKSLRPDVIFHLAAQSSVRLSWENPHLTAEVNALGAVNLFEGIRKQCPEAKTVVIGSGEEYGKINYDSPVKETQSPQPKNVYALTKYFQEQLAKIYVDAYGLDLVMTRSFNHFGPYQSEQFVVADFCSQVAEIEKGRREPVIRVGNLSAYRDFTDVRDVVNAYLILAQKGERGEVYNVGSGRCIEISKILEMILSLTEQKIKVQRDQNKYRPLDVSCIQADVSKIKALGWEPKIPPEKTVEDTLNFFREK